MTEINPHCRIGRVKYKNVIELAHPGKEWSKHAYDRIRDTLDFAENEEPGVYADMIVVLVRQSDGVLTYGVERSRDCPIPEALVGPMVGSTINNALTRNRVMDEIFGG